MKTMCGYPPKCNVNGTKDHGISWPADPWPGDTYTDALGTVYRYASDGTGWYPAVVRARTQFPERKAG